VKINYHRLKKGGEDFPELCKFNGEQSMKNNRIILEKYNCESCDIPINSFSFSTTNEPISPKLCHKCSIMKVTEIKVVREDGVTYSKYEYTDEEM